MRIIQSQQKQHNTTLKKILITSFLSVILIGTSFTEINSIALAQDADSAPKGNTNSVQIPTNNSNGTSKTEGDTQDRQQFTNSADRVTADAALGDEIALLPGPNINFNDLLRIVITWSASLAASVAIFIFILRSFAAIQGTEDSRNKLKSTIIKILIGLTLIFFSFQIISFVMGIIWATA